VGWPTLWKRLSAQYIRNDQCNPERLSIINFQCEWSKIEAFSTCPQVYYFSLKTFERKKCFPTNLLQKSEQIQNGLQLTTPNRDKLQMSYPAEANHSVTNFQSFMKSSWYKSSEPNQGQDSLKEPVIFMKSLAKNQQFGRRILDRFLNFLRTAVTCQNQILRYFENHGYISELVDLIFLRTKGYTSSRTTSYLFLFLITAPPGPSRPCDL